MGSVAPQIHPFFRGRFTGGLSAAICVFIFIWLFLGFVDLVFGLLTGMRFGLLGFLFWAGDILLLVLVYLAALTALLFIIPEAAQAVLQRAVYAYRISIFPFNWYMRVFSSESGKQMKARHTRRKQARSARRKFRGTKLD